MKKARALLKSGSMTVEAIAENVGYQNVEHFNRLFKKKLWNDSCSVQKQQIIGKN